MHAFLSAQGNNRSLVVKAELIGGIKEGEDVFRGYADLDIVYIIEDIATAGLENLDVFSHVLDDFGRFCEGQDVLGVDAATPEDNLIAKHFF